MEETEPTEFVPRNNRYSWIWIIVTFAVLFFFGYLFYSEILKNPCDIPVAYTIGNIDSRFKISPAEVRNVADDAANRWNNNLHQQVYRYDPNAKLKINLVYDERQQKLDATKAQISEFDKESQTITEFRTKVENLSIEYQQDLDDYNARVTYWNSRGGAPADVYSQLNAERASLEQRRIKINQMASLLNTQISENNSNIQDFNSQLEKDKNKIVTSGEYFTDGTKINIYTYGDEKELRLVLMHELGHALSFSHDNISTSIMYPVLQDQNMESPEASTEDKDLMDKTCAIGTNSLDWETIIHRIRSKLSRLSTQQ